MAAARCCKHLTGSIPSCAPPFLPTLVRVMRKKHLHDIQKPDETSIASGGNPIVAVDRGPSPFFVAAHIHGATSEGDTLLFPLFPFSLGGNQVITAALAEQMHADAVCVGEVWLG